MEASAGPQDNQSWLLLTLSRAWTNVPPGMETPFQVLDQGSSYVIAHPGLEGRTLSPDWLAFRRLVRNGYISQTDTTFVLTDKGLDDAFKIMDRSIGSSTATTEDVWVSPGHEPSNLQVRVFCAYSHHDANHLDEFKKHMSVLQRSGTIGLWTDKDILGGREWENEIDQHLLSDHVIFLLVSADFFASDYCSAKEMNVALQRHREGKAWVIPVIVRDCDWQSSPIGSLQAFPQDGRPVTGWSDQDEAWADVVRRFRGVLKEIPSSLGNTGDSLTRDGPGPGRSTVEDADSSESRQDSSDENPEDQELGILDFEEQAGESSNSIVEQLSLVTEATVIIQAQIQQWLSTLPSGKPNLSLVEKRKVASALAEIFESYSSDVQESATVIESQFDLFGESLFGLHRHIDYGDEEQRVQARLFMETARNFSNDLAPFVSQIESARAALKTIPILTKELRITIKQCSVALSTLANSVRKGMDQAEKVALAIEDRLS